MRAWQLELPERSIASISDALKSALRTDWRAAMAHCTVLSVSYVANSSTFFSRKLVASDSFAPAAVAK